VFIITLICTIGGCTTDRTAPADSAIGQLTFTDAGRSVSYPGQSGMSALSTLRGAADVEIEVHDFGELVVAINGVRATSGRSFWQFRVNGEASVTGAASVIAGTHDEFSWRLTELRQRAETARP